LREKRIKRREVERGGKQWEERVIKRGEGKRLRG